MLLTITEMCILGSIPGFPAVNQTTKRTIINSAAFIAEDPSLTLGVGVAIVDKLKLAGCVTVVSGKLVKTSYGDQVLERELQRYQRVLGQFTPNVPLQE